MAFFLANLIDLSWDITITTIVIDTDIMESEKGLVKHDFRVDVESTRNDELFVSTIRSKSHYFGSTRLITSKLLEH